MVARAMVDGRPIEFDTRRGWLFSDTKKPIPSNELQVAGTWKPLVACIKLSSWVKQAVRHVLHKE